MRKNILFTSDTHFWHSNIIKYVKRPFKNIDEMNETLIRNWNSVVSDNDDVYHLGEFGFGGPKRLEQIITRLKGNKFLIKGNHDHSRTLKKLEKHFVWIKDVELINVHDRLIWLSHYAHRTWPQKKYGTWHLYGHSHGTLSPAKDKSLDVGVDIFNYYPIPFEVIKNVMEVKFDECQNTNS